MHLRRALLLFAIVLGLAAVAASMSRTERSPAPRPSPPTSSDEPPTVRPAPDPGTRTILFRQAHRPQVRDLRLKRAAMVVVAVNTPGQAELPGLASTDTAEPATPASFDVYASRMGRFAVVFHPADGGHAQRLGTLRVVRGRVRD